MGTPSRGDDRIAIEVSGSKQRAATECRPYSVIQQGLYLAYRERERQRIVVTSGPIARVRQPNESYDRIIGRTQITMNGQIRIEIIGRDAFWRNAVLVEWGHQYPERELVAQSSVCYVIDTEWLVDLKRVADGCFSKIVVAPEDLGRRSWLRQFIPPQRDNQT